MFFWYQKQFSLRKLHQDKWNNDIWYYFIKKKIVSLTKSLLQNENLITFIAADATEKRLITEVYDFAKSIAELQLTESELALYSALVLLQPGKSRIIIITIIIYSIRHKN